MKLGWPRKITNENRLWFSLVCLKSSSVILMSTIYRINNVNILVDIRITELAFQHAHLRCANSGTWQLRCVWQFLLVALWKRATHFILKCNRNCCVKASLWHHILVARFQNCRTAQAGGSCFRQQHILHILVSLNSNRYEGCVVGENCPKKKIFLKIVLPYLLYF